MVYQWILSLLLITACIPCILSDAHNPNTDEIVEISVSSDGNAGKPKPIHQTKPKPRPKIKRTPSQHPAAMGIIMKNPRSYPVRYYWWSGTNSVYQGNIRPRSVTATNSYVGHIFYFTYIDGATREETEFYRIHIVADVNQYVLPSEPGKENDPHYLELMKEKKFVEDYYTRTGYPWLAHYPRDPPIHHMWSADFIGQKHTVISNQTYWTCIPDSESSTIATEDDIEQCHKSATKNEQVTLELEVISQEPRAFRVKNTLSDAECQLIKRLAQPKIKRSRAGQDGGLETNTRTSSNTWLGRNEHYIMDTIYRRAADILNISEALFQPGTKQNIVEDMQVVYYEYGQEYTAHHDFGADGRPQQRYITLLFYLNDQVDNESGGETNFPKARNGQGLAVHPGKGSSIMFYSILPDGNADDKSLHAALPIEKGVKWLANFWVWDPAR